MEQPCIDNSKIDPVLYQQFLNYREMLFNGDLTLVSNGDKNLTMHGKLLSYQKCPRCSKFFNKDTGKALVCENNCLTSATRFYINLYWENKCIKIYRDINGRILSSYELAHHEHIDINQEIKDGTFDPRDRILARIKELQFDNNIDAWLERQKKRLDKDEISPSYYSETQRIVKNHFKKFFKNRSVRDIKTKDVEDFYYQLPQDLKLKTQKNMMDLLRKYFNDLFDREEILRKPKFPKIEIPEPHWNWVGEDLQNLIYEQIPDVHKPIFAFIKEHGVRPGEARALFKEDCDFERGAVIIRRNFSNEILRNVTKQKRQRVIPIQDDVLLMMKKLPVLNGFMFLDDRGRRYSKTKLQKIFTRAKNVAGIEDLTLYQWGRHSFASQAINNGVPQNIVGAFLGHSDAKMTKRYAHTNIDGLKLVFKKKTTHSKIHKLPKAKRDTNVTY